MTPSDTHIQYDRRVPSSPRMRPLSDDSRVQVTRTQVTSLEAMLTDAREGSPGSRVPLPARLYGRTEIHADEHNRNQGPQQEPASPSAASRRYPPKFVPSSV